MIYIFYCTSHDQLASETFIHFLKKLPEDVKSQVLKFKKWEDRQRSLFSKLLLVEGLNMLSLHRYSLQQMKFTKYRRPYFDNDIDFNISHSGDYIVCAISLGDKVGIDIEEIKGIPLGDFENEFSRKEMKAILSSKNRLNTFYTLWTQKEAFLKAIGTGLYVPLNKIEIDNKKIKWNKQDWFLNEIALSKEYISHLCTNVFHSEIEVQKIVFQKSIS